MEILGNIFGSIFCYMIYKWFVNIKQLKLEEKIEKERKYEEQKKKLEEEALEERKKYILTKYKEKFLIDAILNQEILIGMSKDELIDSWGLPDEVKQTVMKTKIKEEYRYVFTKIQIRIFLV